MRPSNSRCQALFAPPYRRVPFLSRWQDELVMRSVSRFLFNLFDFYDTLEITSAIKVFFCRCHKANANPSISLSQSIAGYRPFPIYGPRSSACRIQLESATAFGSSVNLVEGRLTLCVPIRDLQNSFASTAIDLSTDMAHFRMLSLRAMSVILIL